MNKKNCITLHSFQDTFIFWFAQLNNDIVNMNCWVTIICSKFVCSKNLLDTILLLLDTIRANDKKVKNGRQSKNICRTCISRSFTFRQKNINCSNCKWSTKVLENVNCSTQFIVKKMVYMFGS